ncbi:MAG: alpha/beta fold hydrolase [Vicinamibacterales bacterium]|nr:alpha/beta fold hydrolase [Vicinamibacterales bacterium]
MRYPAPGSVASGDLLILAHGAGAGQHSPFMTRYAQELAARGPDVVTFNFPYMDAGRKAPDRAPLLQETFRDIIATVAARDDAAATRVFIGGKSMGGRMATHLAATPDQWPLATPLAGVVVFGYPLLPPGGRPARAAHLPHLAAPTLFVQGTRDSFGDPDAIRAATPGVSVLDILSVEGGDHSFAVLKRSGRDQDAVHRAIWDGVVSWMTRLKDRTAAAGT